MPAPHRSKGRCGSFTTVRRIRATFLMESGVKEDKIWERDYEFHSQITDPMSQAGAENEPTLHRLAIGSYSWATTGRHVWEAHWHLSLIGSWREKHCPTFTSGRLRLMERIRRLSSWVISTTNHSTDRS